MHKNSTNNNQIYLKSVDNDFYFEKNKIILDKTCPMCKRHILEEKDFCDCGFFLKAAKTSRYWSTIIFIWLIIGFIILTGIINMEKFKGLAYNKFKENKMDLYSLSPVNIQIITNLKNSPYGVYIQNIYLKPRENNKLMVLIKPNSWAIITPKAKKDLITLIEDKWKILYQQNYPDSNKKPEVYFANPE